MLFLDAKNQRGAAIELSGKQAGEDVTVKMLPCGSASVRIVDDRGQARSRRPLARAPGGCAHAWGFLGRYSAWRRNQMTSPLQADSIYVSNLDQDRYRDLKTDANGRMTFPTLIPGATYRIIVFNQPVKTEIEFTVKPGEAKDLGDLKIRNLEHAG